MLKIFADECVHTDLVSAIQRNGFDILSVKQAGLTGIGDEDIFDFAIRNQRILLTFDRGFGDIFRFSIKRGAGVIIVLVGQMNREEIIDIVLKFLFFVKESEIRGKLAVIGRNRIRILGR